MKATIAAKAKKNQQLSQGAGNKGSQISANLSEPIDTKEELAKQASAYQKSEKQIKHLSEFCKPDRKMTTD